ncbi:MAG: peptidyl-prolyl cis-trans isomerase [Sedimentisphaerales bacterium]|nr:peptidyl-prolyl cis-trans isomerase [Sedimentisphaerales bacterium]
MFLQRCSVWTALLVFAAGMTVFAADETPQDEAASDKAAGATPQGEAVKTETETPKEPGPDEVLVEVNGEKLLMWQAQEMVKQRAARDVPGAADFWTTIKLKSNEAMRQKLDASKENAWVLNLYREFYLSRLLDEKSNEAAAQTVTEEQARKTYDENPGDYARPMTAEVKHILLTSRTDADQVAEKARAEGADFDALVKEHSQANDKSRQGIVRGNNRLLTQLLGKDVLDAVMAAKEGDTLGPIQGAKGFEIVKVNKVTPEQQIPFDEVKDRILQQIKAEAARKADEQLIQKLRDEAQIIKTPVLEQLVEEQKKAAPPPPRQPGPVRR